MSIAFLSILMFVLGVRACSQLVGLDCKREVVVVNEGEGGHGGAKEERSSV